MDMRFTRAAWDTLKAYFEAAYQQLGDLELQGYGRVKMEDGEPVCYEVGIPEQEVSMAKTDATWDQMLAFLNEKIDFKNVKAAKKEVPTWRLWWHTHGKGGLGVSYSGTDEKTLRSLAEETGDHMWGLVFITNTMDSTLYLATQRPIPLMASLDKAVCDEIDVDVPSSITAEVSKKVSKKIWVAPVNSKPGAYPYFGNYGIKHAKGCLCLSCKQAREEEGAGESNEAKNEDYLSGSFMEGWGD